jgi:hypothetical protein
MSPHDRVLARGNLNGGADVQGSESESLEAVALKDEKVENEWRSKD